MIFEDLEIIWREEESHPSHTIDDEALRRIVAERARTYRSKILRSDMAEIGVETFIVTLFLGIALWSIVKDGGVLSLDPLPLIVVAIGYAFVASFKLVSRQRQKRREENFDDSVHGNLQKLLANADYQIRLHRKYIWWYILPLFPGFILLFLTPADGPMEILFFGIAVCLLFGAIYWGNINKLRKEFVPQKKELESLLEGLGKKGGQTAEILSSSSPYPKDDRKKKIRFLVALAVSALGFCLAGWILYIALQPLEEPQVPEFDIVSAFDESEMEQIDTWLQEQVERCDYPSLSVAIVRRGETVYEKAFGFENTWKRKKATTETAYHVASVTKAFTASLAVLLHDRGVIDLDQPVLSYLPGDVSISTTPEQGAKITLRQLASHTSGLPRRVPGVVQSVEGRYQLETDRLYGLLADVTLEFEPGTGERYSNLGFGLLGHALELAADKPLNQLLQELLCDPLKLERTAFHVKKSLPVATGYTTPPQLPEKHSYRQRLAGSGGLVTSVGDLAKFLAAQMEPGVFTSEMLAQLHTGTNRALGWSIDTNNPTGRILSKNGGRGNCSAWIGFAPDHGIGVAVITNIGKPDVDSIGRWLLERSVPGGSKPVSKVGYAKVAPYTGVRWENDRPIVRVEDRWAPLISIDGIPIKHIVDFAQKEFGDIARKRFAEDLPQLLSTMGHEPDWEVTLGLETKDGQVEHLQIKMTEANRNLVRDR